MQHMRDAFRAGRFEDGLTHALEEVSALLVQHFPAQAGRVERERVARPAGAGLGAPPPGRVTRMKKAPALRPGLSALVFGAFLFLSWGRAEQLLALAVPIPLVSWGQSKRCAAGLPPRSSQLGTEQALRAWSVPKVISFA